MEKLVVFFALAFVALAQETTVVTLSKGSLRGYIQQFQEPLSNTDVRLRVFKGVPFAEPPVRFMPPVEKLPWSEEYDATFYRYACPQPYLPQEYMSEDCLFMNIWAPEITQSELLPVMIVFHGGDYQTGSASADLTSGAPMAAINNVIVVNFNYRLGPFGFGTSDSDLVGGNMGLMDQAMAMRWVKENIAAFGGDNTKVTVVGDTAGAASISLQMVSRRGRLQFDQAIIQDGSFYSYWGFNANRTAESEKAGELAYRVGCPGGPEYDDDEVVLRCFNEASVQDIINAAGQMNFEGKLFLPTVDGNFIPERPSDMIARGDFKQCPVIGGYAADAGTRDVLYLKGDFNRQTPPQLTAEDMAVVLAVSGGSVSPDPSIQTALQYAVAQQYLDYTKIFRADYDYFTPVVAIHGDASFTCPLLNFTWSWYNMSSNSPVYIFELSYVPAISIFRLYNISTAPWLGATVEEVVQFALGLGFVPELNAAGFNPPDADKRFALAIMRYFSNFAKSGDPNSPEGVPVSWLPYTPLMQYNLNMGSTVTLEDGPKSQVCHLWNVLLPSLKAYLEELTYRRDSAESDSDSDSDLSSEWRREFRDWQENNEAWKEAFETYQEGTCN